MQKLKRKSLFSVGTNSDNTVTEKIDNESQKENIEVKCKGHDTMWKSFDTSRPDIFTPCEFYVNKGTDKKDIFYGYVTRLGSVCTDDPYNLVVMRKKYNNLYYREIDGCTSINECSNFFPDCRNCKKRNKIK